MRALKILLFLTALGTLVSCSKEDDDPQVDRNMVLGEWNLTEFSYSGTSSVTDGGETTSVSYTAEAVDLDARVVFVDGSNYTTAGSYTIILTTTLEGESYVENYSYSDISGSGTYAIVGNKMTTTPKKEGQLIQASEAVIQELTPTRMVLDIEQRLVQEIEGMEVVISLDMVQVLTR